MENYLDILEESLIKKSQVLDRVQCISQKQLELLDSAEMSLESYDKYVDEKAECIDALNRLDDGFEVLYQKIAGELQDNRQKYGEQIKRLQKLIAEVTEKSISIQALEARNKSRVEDYFRKEKKSIRTARMTSQAAMNYYQNMNNIKNVQAQFLDKKK